MAHCCADSTISSSSNLPKKRSFAEEEAQSEKVLTCMGCGHLFESLQVRLKWMLAVWCKGSVFIALRLYVEQVVRELFL